MRHSGVSAAVAVVAACAGVFVVGASDARAFCRTTTCDTCVPPDTGCVTEGIPLSWSVGCVSYDLQEGASKWASLEVATGLADAALAAWSGVTCDGQQPSITFKNLGPVACQKREFNDDVHTAGGNANVIVFRDAVWTSVGDPASTLALTTVTFNKKSGEIVDADIEINGSQSPLSTSDALMAGGYDLASILAHETGHFLGLAHSTEPCTIDGSDCPTMNGLYRRGSTAYRTLEADDKAGLCAIYPPTRTVTDESCTPIHGFSGDCGHAPDPDGCAVGGTGDLGGAGRSLAWAVLAFTIVRWSRRRPRQPANRTL